MNVYVERTYSNSKPKVYAECAKITLLNSIVNDLMEGDGYGLNEIIEETWYGELDRFYKLMLTDEGRAQVKKMITDCLMSKAVNRFKEDYDLIEVQD